MEGRVVERAGVNRSRLSGKEEFADTTRFLLKDLLGGGGIASSFPRFTLIKRILSGGGIMENTLKFRLHCSLSRLSPSSFTRGGGRKNKLA